MSRTYQQLQRDCTQFGSLPCFGLWVHSGCCENQHPTAASGTASTAYWPASISHFILHLECRCREPARAHTTVCSAAMCTGSWRHCMTRNSSNLEHKASMCLTSVAKLAYLVVVIRGQQTVERRHRLEADVLVRGQVKGALRQVWQILKVDDMFLLSLPAVIASLYTRLGRISCLQAGLSETVLYHESAALNPPRSPCSMYPHPFCSVMESSMRCSRKKSNLSS